MVADLTSQRHLRCLTVEDFRRRRLDDYQGLETGGLLQIRQWAFKGLPVYYYVKDMKPGDATGEGAGGGLWHVVKM